VSYDGAVTISARTGEPIVGTSIVYQGKAPDGRAIMNIGGQQGLKSVADSVNWSGALVLFSLVDLRLRVVSYDENGMTLAGTIHIVVQEPNPTAGDLSVNRIAAFTFVASFTVARGGMIPGTTVSYVGARTGGAEFANLDQFPLRERGDSVVWQGHVRERVGLRVEQRVVDYNDDRVILIGTLNVVFEQ
jgi:hypothetical protein